MSWYPIECVHGYDHCPICDSEEGMTYEGLWRNKENDSLMTIVDWEEAGYNSPLFTILVLFQMVKGTLGPSGKPDTGSLIGKTGSFESIIPRRKGVKLYFYTSVGGLTDGLLTALVRK